MCQQHRDIFHSFICELLKICVLLETVKDKMKNGVKLSSNWQTCNKRIKKSAKSADHDSNLKVYYTNNRNLRPQRDLRRGLTSAEKFDLITITET